MAKNFARCKGQRAERAAIDLLQPIVDRVYDSFQVPANERPKLQRNTLQSDGGGFDIVGLNWLALEIKHQETLALTQWWVQCSRQAEQYNREPVLMYKQNRVAWRVRMRGRLPVGDQATGALVDISIEDFLNYFEARISYELATGDYPK